MSDANRIQWELPRPWPTLRVEAYNGLVGDIIRAIAPHSEADPAALLFTVLCGLGSIAGLGPYRRMGESKHYPRLFVALIGRSNLGAKGESKRDVWPFLHCVDPFFGSRVATGIQSGEGLVSLFKEPEDEKESTTPIDKRLFILEEEMSRPLNVGMRPGSTLSDFIRIGYDGGTLETTRSKDRIRVEGVSMSILTHCTPDELRRLIVGGDQLTNGFANRFLYVCSERSQDKPFGGNQDHGLLAILGNKAKTAIDAVGNMPFEFSGDAYELWDNFCKTTHTEESVIDGILARKRPHCIRLIMCFAMLSGKPIIQASHVKSGIACWDYCLESAWHIFEKLAANKLEKKIIEYVRAAHPSPRTLTEISNHAGRANDADNIHLTLDNLEESGRLCSEIDDSKPGRSTKLYTALLPPYQSTVVPVISGEWVSRSARNGPPPAPSIESEPEQFSFSSNGNTHHAPQDDTAPVTRDHAEGIAPIPVPEEHDPDAVSL
jgi:hypothetical protein